jgi:hypothetical protein
MSLNKFFNVDTGFDILKMNIGADEVKCNNIDTTTLNNQFPLIYEPPKDPTAPTNINEGAICIFQNIDDPQNITKSNYIYIENYTGGGGGQRLNMRTSPIINATNITNEVIDGNYQLNTVPEGSTTQSIAPQRWRVMGVYIYSPRATLPLIPTSLTVDRIGLQPEQIARADTTYYFKFTCDNCALNIVSNPAVTPDFYTFEDNYAISPAFNECIEVIYVFRRATNKWVRCKQTT